MRFEDMHPWPGNSDHYPITNESLELWDKLLQGLWVSRAAGICSGGEVGFFNLLPRVRRDLVLVDHSYRSLYFAFVKYAALQHLGPEETHRRLANPTVGLTSLAAALEIHVPEVVTKAWGLRGGSHVFGDNHYAIQGCWGREATKVRLTKACAKLDKVTFVHGDLTDLSNKGKFGLLYLSNALEYNHPTRERTRSVPTNVASCVRPGGYILTAEVRYSDLTYPPNWEVVNEVKHPYTRHNGELSWIYKLHRVHAVAA